VSPLVRRLLPVFVAACAALSVSASPASAATPCWKLLLNDWYDGTISNVYPIHCYHDAIKHLPTDIKVYSSAADDINRAMRQAINGEKRSHNTVTSPEPAPPTPGRTPSTSTPPLTTKTTPTPPKKPKKGPIGKALRDITPGGADSFPLPLLILGLLAILLVLAGVGGMIWRRYQGGGPAGGPPASTP
jgi:hypothetical protein